MKMPFILFLVSCFFGLLFNILIYYVSYRLYDKKLVKKFLFGGALNMFRNLKIYKDYTIGEYGRVCLAYYLCYLCLFSSIFSFFACCYFFLIGQAK